MSCKPKKTPFSVASSPLTALSDMEEDEPAVSLDMPSLTVPSVNPEEMMDDDPDSETEDNDEWEGGSVCSDASTEVMLEEDDDDVVPRSFVLHATSDGDYAMSDSEHPPSGEQLEPPPEVEKRETLPSSQVYGSDRQHPVCILFAIFC
jgi:hypothetical protein